MYALFVPSSAHYLRDVAAHYYELELRYDLKQSRLAAAGPGSSDQHERS
jgi:hypothetical protein